MIDIFVRGLGLWSTGFADPESFCAGQEKPDLGKPDAPLLEGPLKRRATPLTRLAVDVLCQAARRSGSDLATIPTIWATAHGEHSPAIELLAMMHRADGKLSPTRFHNSVHNTASGYASIAAGNRAGSTTLTGGPELVAATLTEAMCRVLSTGSDVAAIVADEPLQPPFERKDPMAPLAVALILSPNRAGARARLSMPRLEDVAGSPCDSRFGTLHVSAILALVRAVVNDISGVVPLQLQPTASPGRPIWVVDVESMSSEAESPSKRA